MGNGTHTYIYIYLEISYKYIIYIYIYVYKYIYIIYIHHIYLGIYWLVVLTILKNMKVNGKDHIPDMMENKKMFETTNQHMHINISYIYTLYTRMNILENII